MARIKKIHGEAFKAKMALESVWGDLTANQICSRYGVHPTLVNRWQKKLIAGVVTILAGTRIPVVLQEVFQVSRDGGAEAEPKAGKMVCGLTWI